ncbi:hypothetical protein NC651_036019 [Populus alba x Populus x berolinensis]|nr:hypothetical protein NC651_036019 [Populus alba x Populus x berolinensis]
MSTAWLASFTHHVHGGGVASSRVSQAALSGGGCVTSWTGSGIGLKFEVNGSDSMEMLWLPHQRWQLLGWQGYNTVAAGSKDRWENIQKHKGAS